jgi:hypothetical protein
MRGSVGSNPTRSLDDPANGSARDSALIYWESEPFPPAKREMDAGSSTHQPQQRGTDMSIIHDQAYDYLNAKDRLKQKEEAARNAAILRALNAESEKAQEMRLRNSALRVTLLVAIAFNIYAAAKGWGLM